MSTTSAALMLAGDGQPAGHGCSCPRGQSRSRCSLRLGPCVLAAVVLAPASPVRAHGGRRAPLSPPESSAVEHARQGAARRLQDPGCRTVLSAFQDARGRTIARDLEQWELTPAEYLGILPFRDGSGQLLCQSSNVMLVATPNVPRVMVCPGFAKLAHDAPELAEILVIHELLHTLGLGENPPASADITQRVGERCRTRAPVPAGSRVAASGSR